MFRAGRYQQRKFVPNFDANTDVSRKDMILEPATELKKSNIEEYEKKLLQHVGKEYPICATCFELYTHDIHGYKYYADREEIAIAPLSRRQEESMFQTEIHAHLNKMDAYHKKTQKKEESLQSIYSHKQTTVSKKSVPYLMKYSSPTVYCSHRILFTVCSCATECVNEWLCA